MILLRDLSLGAGAGSLSGGGGDAPGIYRIPLTFADVPGYTATPGPNGGVVLSGHIPGEVPSGKPGIYVELFPDLEQAFSGQTIRMHTHAISASNTTAYLSYSTSEVGNTGWRTFAADPAGTSAFVDYSVPPVVLGFNDFIGFAPDPFNTGQTIELVSLVIEVL